MNRQIIYTYPAQFCIARIFGSYLWCLEFLFSTFSINIRPLCILNLWSYSHTPYSELPSPTHKLIPVEKALLYVLNVQIKVIVIYSWRKWLEYSLMNKNAFVNLCLSTDFKILAAGRHIRSFFKNYCINGLHRLLIIMHHI